MGNRPRLLMTRLTALFPFATRSPVLLQFAYLVKINFMAFVRKLEGCNGPHEGSIREENLASVVQQWRRDGDATILCPRQWKGNCSRYSPTYQKWIRNKARIRMKVAY